jgi:hypothetical protein
VEVIRGKHTHRKSGGHNRQIGIVPVQKSRQSLLVQ